MTAAIPAPTMDASGTAIPEVVTCAVRAFAAVAVAADAIDGLRLQPGPALRRRFPPALLRYADEQTVVAVAAVLHAIARFGLTDADFSDWGVIAAPYRQGRLRMAQAIGRFRREGARATSPMIVPHLSLHAISGTISQVLQSHGVNFGVSSGADHVADGLMAALATLADDGPAQLWLVLTSWDHDPTPDEQGRCTTARVCHAVALALARVEPVHACARLTLRPTAAGTARTGTAADLIGLANFLLGDCADEEPSWVHPLRWGGAVELS